MFNRPGWQASMALAFIAGGFIVLFIAWNGAASIDFVQGQVPYLISGGFVGLGMIIVGVGLMLFESGRRAGTKVDRKMDELSEVIKTIQVSSNGSSKDHAMAEATFANGTVVVGARSYHRPDCRLVEGKDALVYATQPVANEQGLKPCRVCNPES